MNIEPGKCQTVLRKLFISQGRTMKQLSQAKSLMRQRWIIEASVNDWYGQTNIISLINLRRGNPCYAESDKALAQWRVGAGSYRPSAPCYWSNLELSRRGDILILRQSWKFHLSPDPHHNCAQRVPSCGQWALGRQRIPKVLISKWTLSRSCLAIHPTSGAPPMSHPVFVWSCPL